LTPRIRAGPGEPAAALGPLLDAAWAARDKTLRHSLAPLAATLGIPPMDVTDALATVNGGGRTAFQLSPWEYGQLAARVEEAVARRAGSRKGASQNP
jgi:hypothetical protein